jgi:hypothetical protein
MGARRMLVASTMRATTRNFHVTSRALNDASTAALPVRKPVGAFRGG